MTRAKGRMIGGRFHVYRPTARELKIAADMQAPPACDHWWDYFDVHGHPTFNIAIAVRKRCRICGLAVEI